MYNKIAAMLDIVADSLEANGLIREAKELDVIANTLESKSDKTLIIMRGLPGSGKSTKAKKIQSELGGKIFATDEYPGLYDKDSDGKIQYFGEEEDETDKPLIAAAHEWNQERAFNAMASGVSPVIVDNTNVQKWEAKPYVQKAKGHGYNLVVEEADTPWKFNVKELNGRNTHGVSLPVLEGMLERWEKDFDEESILKSKAPGEKDAGNNVLADLQKANKELEALVQALSDRNKYMTINRASIDDADRRETEEEISDLKDKIVLKKKEIDKITGSIV